MLCAQAFQVYVALRTGVALKLRLLCNSLLVQHSNKFCHDAAAGERVVVGAVVVKVRQTEPVCDNVELVALEIRKQALRKRERVHISRVKADVAALRGGLHKADVKLRIVRHKRAPVRKRNEASQRLVLIRCVKNVPVGDAGQLHNFARDRLVGIDKGLKAALDFAVLHNHRADFRDTLSVWVKARRFNVEGAERVVKARLLVAAVDGQLIIHIVYVVALNAVYDFYAAAFSRLPNFGKGLRNAVVRHRNCGVSPFGGALNRRSRTGQRVKRGKAGVQMQLNALFRGAICAHGLCFKRDAARLQNNIVVKTVIAHAAGDRQVHSGLNVTQSAQLLTGLKIF